MASRKQEPSQSEQPKGTLAIVLAYMVTIIIIWSWVYSTLLSRGVTQ